MDMPLPPNNLSSEFYRGFHAVIACNRMARGTNLAQKALRRHKVVQHAL